MTLLGQYRIGDPASSIGHPTSVIQHTESNIGNSASNTGHPAPNIQHPLPNIFFKLMKQTQKTSTKNPLYALSYGYEDASIRKGKRPFGLIFLEKGSSSVNLTQELGSWIIGLSKGKLKHAALQALER